MNEQQAAGLVLANTVRKRRADLRRELSAMDPVAAVDRLEELMMERPDYLRTATLSEACGWIRGWGPSRTTTLASKVALSTYKAAGALTDRQIRLVAVEARKIAAKVAR